MKLVTITRNAENQLALAAKNSAARFLSSRKEKNRAEYLARLNLEVASLVELHQKLHSSPPGQVVAVPPVSNHQ